METRFGEIFSLGRDTLDGFVGLTVVVEVVVVAASVVVVDSVVVLVVDSVVVLVVEVVASSSGTFIKSEASLTTSSVASVLISCRELFRSSKLVRCTPESNKLSAFFLASSDSIGCSLICVMRGEGDGMCVSNGSSFWSKK